MKHAIKDLYHIKGRPGLYTKEYLHAHGVQVSELDEKGKAHSVHSLGGSYVLNIHDANCDCKGYKFGEHTYFDTEEELIKEKQLYTEKRAKNARRVAILKKFEALDIEELEQIAAQLGL